MPIDPSLSDMQNIDPILREPQETPSEPQDAARFDPEEEAVS